jgi:PIN domain nuclease of toxin-antitoxin system
VVDGGFTSRATDHRDPFDRMLVVQTRVEGLTVVTADKAITAYDVAILPATE